MAEGADPDRLSNLERFLFGAAGAVAPEVIRWTKLAVATDPLAFPSHVPVYVAATVLFILLGGVFAIAWQDNNRLKCMYYGITFPAFVSAVITTPPSLPR